MNEKEKKMKTFNKAVILLLLFTMIGGICFAAPKKKLDPLDAAIRETSDYLNSNIAKGSKIVILNIQSESGTLSEYIIDELISNAVNDRVFLVVDRQQLDAIRAEQNFQFSGEVDDKQALEIGKFFGAQTIVSGAMGPYGKDYRLRIRALEVQTALVQGQFNKNITKSTAIPILLASKPSGTTTATTASARTTAPAPTQQAVPAAAPAAVPTPVPAPVQTVPAVPAYKIGDTGPAGGIIFYDKRNNSGGWRYLEVAPVEAEFQARWSIKHTMVASLQTTIGSGKRNTQLINEKFSQTSGEWDTAAQKCVELNFGGFNDWFLPSKDELDQMYGQLKRRNLGNFKNARYLTSSSVSNDYLSDQNFGNGEQDRLYLSSVIGSSNNFVRPIRQVEGPAN